MDDPGPRGAGLRAETGARARPDGERGVRRARPTSVLGAAARRDRHTGAGIPQRARRPRDLHRGGLRKHRSPSRPARDPAYSPREEATMRTRRRYAALAIVLGGLAIQAVAHAEVTDEEYAV